MVEPSIIIVIFGLMIKTNSMLASVQSTGQAGNSASGAMCIGNYLAGKKWDVIVINFGIHDTWVHQYVPPKQYGENLERIFTAAKGAVPFFKMVPKSRFEMRFAFCVLLPSTEGAKHVLKVVGAKHRLEFRINNT